MPSCCKVGIAKDLRCGVGDWPILGATFSKENLLLCKPRTPKDLWILGMEGSGYRSLSLDVVKTYRLQAVKNKKVLKLELNSRATSINICAIRERTFKLFSFAIIEAASLKCFLVIRRFPLLLIGGEVL